MVTVHGIGILVLACLTAASAGAQAPSAAEARARVRFERFDADRNGWLAGPEIDACACRAYDTNRSGEVTWIEFFAGELGAAIDSLYRIGGHVPRPRARSDAASPPSGVRRERGKPSADAWRRRGR